MKLPGHLATTATSRSSFRSTAPWLTSTNWSNAFSSGSDRLTLPTYFRFIFVFINSSFRSNLLDVLLKTYRNLYSLFSYPSFTSACCFCFCFFLTDRHFILLVQFYNIFGLLWGLFFLAALDEMVLAGVFASWYWTLDKSKVPTFPLLASFYR